MMPPTLHEARADHFNGKAVTTASGADHMVGAYNELTGVAAGAAPDRGIFLQRALLHIEAAYHLATLAEILDLSDA